MTNYGAWAGLGALALLGLITAWKIKQRFKKEVIKITHVRYPEKEERKEEGRSRRDRGAGDGRDRYRDSELEEEDSGIGTGHTDSSSGEYKTEADRGDEGGQPIQDVLDRGITPDSSPNQSSGITIPNTEPIN